MNEGGKKRGRTFPLLKRLQKCSFYSDPSQAIFVMLVAPIAAYNFTGVSGLLTPKYKGLEVSKLTSKICNIYN